MAQAQQEAITTIPRRIKIIAGADAFGCNLKDKLLTHLRSLNIEVDDLGTDKYYSVGEEIGRRVSQANTDDSVEIRGLVGCGTGVGVGIFANKFPRVYAATCLTPADALNARSINNCNVLAVSGMSTAPEVALDILNTFLNTPFKAPCPASGSNLWPEDFQSFLDTSVKEMSEIGKTKIENKTDGIADSPCFICSLAKSWEQKEFSPVDIMPGASMKILRETPVG